LGRCSIRGLLLLLPLQLTAAPAADYAEVSALFAKHFVVCHNGDGAPLGLRLDSHAALMMGSQKGPVVVAGDPEASELVRRLRGVSQPRMPLTGPPFLDEAQIALISNWIRAGARPSISAEPAVLQPHRLPAAGAAVTYADIEPILLQRCIKCHRDGGQLGPPPEGLRLQTRSQLLAGGDRVVVVPGIPLASELIRRIKGLSRPRMPFDGPPYLSQQQIRLLSDWVAQGAPDAEGRPAEMPVGRPVRLEGVLSGRWELDGLPLEIGPGARIKKRVGIGSYVRIRGRVGEHGRILVERIQAR
jgi:mono/diheme cytochrome c family protein